jgi:DNA-binding ferritin-like protein (Dps family)
MSILDKIIGSLEDKKAYNDNEKRAKALPGDYAKAYKEIKQYIFSTSGIVSMEPLVTLVDILEEAAANKRAVTDVTGPDVASFADELVRDAKNYKDGQRSRLNQKFNK